MNSQISVLLFLFLFKKNSKKQVKHPFYSVSISLFAHIKALLAGAPKSQRFNVRISVIFFYILFLLHTLVHRGCGGGSFIFIFQLSSKREQRYIQVHTHTHTQFYYRVGLLS